MDGRLKRLRFNAWMVGAVRATRAIGAASSGLVLAPPATAPAIDLEYRFTLERRGGTHVVVHGNALGAPDGETHLEVTDGWGGVREAGEAIAGMRVFGFDGRELEVERPRPFRWRVQHEPAERLAWVYRIDANAYQSDPSPRTHYLPIVNNRLVHWIGELALVRPTHLDNERAQRVAMEWRGFEEAGWQVVSSFGIGSERIELNLPFRRIREALYVAGVLDVIEHSIRGKPIAVAVAGRGWEFEAHDFADMARRVVELERGFFDDFERSFYLISLIPVGTPDPDGFWFGGTGLTNSFATFTLPSLKLDGGKGEHVRVAKLLLHEMFHEWNGHVLQREPPEELMYWFSEGFTDFYTRRLAVHGAWIDAQGFADDLNATIREYVTSPERAAGAERIAELFWTNRDVQRQPYVRGDLLACVVDQRIRQRSHGKRSLDDFMRALVREARKHPGDVLRISNRMLLAHIEEWTSADTAALVQSVALDGALLELPKDLFAPALRAYETEAGVYDLGFDFDASREASRIIGVREGSSAWRAGLRDGQLLRGMSVWHGRADLEASFQVEENGHDLAIRYLPIADAVPVTLFEVVPEHARLIPFGTR